MNNAKILNAADATATQHSLVIDASQVFSASFQITSSSGSNAGSLQVESSNDPANGLATDSAGNLIPVNWSSLGSAATVTSGATKQIDVPQSSYAGYRWLRVTWTPSAGAGTVTVNAVTLGQ